MSTIPEPLPQDSVKEPPSIVKVKQKLNRWSVFGLVALSAISTTIYVGNVVNLNNLLAEIQKLNVQYEDLSNRNEILKAKLNSLESADKITTIATEKLGMIKPEKAPTVLNK